MMLADTGLSFELTKWPVEVWIALALVPLALLGLGLLLFARRRSAVRTDFAPRPEDKIPNPPDADPFVFGSTQERRASLRRGGNPVPVFMSDAEARASSYHGWVVDRSMGGLCVAVEEAVAPGTILSIRAANAPVTVPWIQIEVRNCRAVDDRWELGCAFVRTPPWGTLLLFG